MTADPKKVVDELTAKAALSAGRDAARRAVEDLLSSDEEKAEREAERAAQAKRRRKKLLAWIVAGAILAIGLVGMMIHYWQWFILAGLVGLAGLYGWHRLKKRLRRPAPDGATAEAPRALEPKKLRVTEPEPSAEELRERRAREAVARAEARVAERHEVDDELAELKARLKK